MPEALHHLVERQAALRPSAEALRCGSESTDYATLWQRIRWSGERLISLGMNPGDRIALWLPKTIDSVVHTFGAAAAGAVFVPINPVLKAPQVAHVLRDSGARFLITQARRLATLEEALAQCPTLEATLTVDEPPQHSIAVPLPITAPQASDRALQTSGRGGNDLAALLYTSGSTGRPKGVMISHANLLDGARIVAEYLDNRPEDCLLAALPLSFDYGFSQITTAFQVGATAVLMDYLLPQQIPDAVQAHGITGLAGVPSLWNRLATLPWPASAAQSLRYITNSGGTLPVTTIQRLRKLLPETQLFLMYGLTEAFRSTYLPPSLLERHPRAIGLPIPEVEIHVVRQDGSECAIGETGELVHVGPLVAQGYWNDPEASRPVFRRWRDGRPAVWSGDRVCRDAEGLLYFQGRSDDTIKTSGYRVSPEEVEEVAMQCEGVRIAIVTGLPDPVLGQQIALAYEGEVEAETFETHCRSCLPTFMQPARIMRLDAIPLTPNGKPDRSRLRAMLEAPI